MSLENGWQGLLAPQALSDPATGAPVKASTGRLYKTDKRQNNQDDYNGPNDVDDVVHNDLSSSAGCTTPGCLIQMTSCLPVPFRESDLEAAP